MNRITMSNNIIDVPLNLSNEVIDLTGDSPVVNSTQWRRSRIRNPFPMQRAINSIDRNLLIRNNLQLPILWDPLTSVERDNSFIQIIEPDEGQIRVNEARNEGEFVNENSVNTNEEYSRAVPCINDSSSGEQVVLSCPICFESLTADRKPMATRCGHIYCAQCLANALERSSKKLCSKCNAPVKIKSCIRLYF